MTKVPQGPAQGKVRRHVLQRPEAADQICLCSALQGCFQIPSSDGMDAGQRQRWRGLERQVERLRMGVWLSAAPCPISVPQALVLQVSFACLPASICTAIPKLGPRLAALNSAQRVCQAIPHCGEAWAV
eukprot:356630-Chlamydomonas_euryale.AAC.3